MKLENTNKTRGTVNQLSLPTLWSTTFGEGGLLVQPPPEIALLMSEALTPSEGKNSGPSGSIAQTASSPTGRTPLTKKLEMMFRVQVDFCARVRWPNPSCSTNVALSPSQPATRGASRNRAAGSALFPIMMIGFFSVLFHGPVKRSTA